MATPAMVSVLLWTLVIYKLECSVPHLEQSRNVVEYLLQKYYNPLRKLSANLPGHAVELEIDIRGTFPSKGHPKRISRAKRHRPKPGIQDETKSPGEERAIPRSLTTHPPPSVTPNAVLITPDQEPMDPAKIPVFMDDLNKALKELEMKLATQSLPTPKIQNQDELSQNGPAQDELPQNGTAQNKPEKGGFQNQLVSLNEPPKKFEALFQILRNAVQIKRSEPKPEEQLEWVQLKIPKTMQF